MFVWLFFSLDVRLVLGVESLVCVVIGVVGVLFDLFWVGGCFIDVVVGILVGEGGEGRVYFFWKMG